MADAPCGSEMVTELIFNPGGMLVKMDCIVAALVPAGHKIVLIDRENATFLLKQLQGFNVIAGGKFS